MTGGEERSRQLWLTAFLILCVVGWVGTSTAFGPIGPEIPVNAITLGNQRTPAVAATADGGFVVTWETPYPNEGEIAVRKFDTSGSPAAAELQVNTYVTFAQTWPDVVADADGGFVVVWNDRAYGRPDLGGIKGQRFTADSDRLGTEFRINGDAPSSEDSYPVAASLNQGTFVVVWRRHMYSPLDEFGIFGRRVDASSGVLSEEFLVDQHSTANEEHIEVAADREDDRFLVVWRGADPERDAYGIVGQPFDDVGNPAGTTFRIDQYGAATFTDWPAAAALPAGGYVVVWHSAYGQDGSASGIRARLLDAVGQPVDADFQVNEYTTGSQYRAAVAAATDGGFVVAWIDLGRIPGQISARRFDAGGVAKGTEFRVNAYRDLDAVFRPAVVQQRDGDFVVVWANLQEQDGSGYGIFARRLSETRLCADAVHDGLQNVVDALFVLRAAVGTTVCASCICDTDASGVVGASDALLVLNVAVGLSANLACPAC